MREGGDLVLQDDIYSIDLGMELEVVNVHGPFQDRMVLWDNLITISFMKEENIIFGGDLNFSLGIS